MYDDMLNGQPSRERHQQVIQEAQEWRRIQNLPAIRRKQQPLVAIRALLVKMFSVVTR